MGRRTCDWCHAPLATERPDARFCSPGHKSRWHHREHRRRAREFVAKLRIAVGETDGFSELVREAEQLFRLAA